MGSLRLVVVGLLVWVLAGCSVMRAGVLMTKAVTDVPRMAGSKAKEVVFDPFVFAPFAKSKGQLQVALDAPASMTETLRFYRSSFVQAGWNLSPPREHGADEALDTDHFRATRSGLNNETIDVDLREATVNNYVFTHVYITIRGNYLWYETSSEAAEQLSRWYLSTTGPMICVPYVTIVCIVPLL